MHQLFRKIGMFFVLIYITLCRAQDQNWEHLSSENPHFVIVIPSYNNKSWHELNLYSVFIQTYKNYHVIYVDDCSTDGTENLVGEFIKKFNFESSVTLVKNTQRVGALENIYNAVHTCKDTDIIVLLDGDDWFPNKDVLQKLQETYSNKSNWLVYSQFAIWPDNVQGWNRSHDKSVYQDPSHVRDYSPSHLRTFYAGLFKLIRREDLLYNDQFFPMTWDMAIMLPMIEMASEGHVEFIPDILYIYNNSNPLNDHKLNKGLQVQLHRFIAAKPKYKPINSRGIDSLL